MGSPGNFIIALVTGGLGPPWGVDRHGPGPDGVQEGRVTLQRPDLVTNAAGNLADRLDKRNGALEARLSVSEQQNLQMRRALIALTEAVEDLLRIIPDEGHPSPHPEAVNTARAAACSDARGWRSVVDLDADVVPCSGKRRLPPGLNGLPL